MPRPPRRTAEDPSPPGGAQGLDNRPDPSLFTPLLTRELWPSKELAGQGVLGGGLKVEGGESSSMWGPRQASQRKGHLGCVLEEDAGSRWMFPDQASVHTSVRLGGPGVSG